MNKGWHLPLQRCRPSRRWRVNNWPFIPGHLARRLVQWGEHNRREFPWRGARDPFHLLMAEMLLRQTRAGHAARIYPDLVRAYGSPQVLAAAQPIALEELLRPAGLAAQRVEALQAMARHLLAHHAGQIPASPKALAATPHVGPYVAGAVACFGFGLPVPLVDTNIIRVMARFTGHGIRGKNPHRNQVLWRRCRRSLPETDVASFNYALLDLSATLCRPSSPGCSVCPLRPGCSFARHELDR